MHPLAEILDRAARGSAPPTDGAVDLLGTTGGTADAVVAFTGHLTIAASIAPRRVREHFPDGDFATWTAPATQSWLERASHRRLVAADIVLAATGLGRAPVVDLDTHRDGLRHARVDQASRHRTEIEVFTTAKDQDGVLVLGRGLVGRREMAFEVDVDRRRKGVGRSLAHAARCLTPTDEIIWAQVAPANAASLRALMAAGFVPVCSENLLVPA